MAEQIHQTGRQNRAHYCENRSVRRAGHIRIREPLQKRNPQGIVQLVRHVADKIAKHRAR